MVDFDGDCLADLFMTVEDGNDPSVKYYEIYLRQERKINNDAISRELLTNGKQSFCLIQVDDISQL